MRQVAGDRQHQIMMIRRHDLDPGAKRRPERPQLLDRLCRCALRRGQDTPAVDEQLGETGIGAGIFGAGDGMRRHEMNAGGEMRRHLAHHRALDRADVGDDGARCEVTFDFLGDRAAGADGNAEDDEIGAVGGLRVAVHHAIGNAEFPDPRPGLFRARGGDDFARQTLSTRGARDRTADQSEADQRHPVETRMRVHGAAMKSRSASTTSRLASSMPMVMRKACGRP